MQAKDGSDASRGRRTRVAWVSLCGVLGVVGCGSRGSGAPPSGNVPAGWSLTTELVGLDLSTVWGDGNEVFAAGNGSTVVHSSDDGKTWDSVDTSAQIGGATPAYRHVAGSGGGDVWIAGAVGDESVLLHSSDHGVSWQRRDVGIIQRLTAAWAFDEKNVLLATADGDVYRAEDGGVTWKHVVTGPGTPLYALWGSRSGYVYAVGGGDAAATVPPPSVAASDGCDGGSTSDGGTTVEGVLRRSTDFGQTWSSVAVFPAGVLTSVWGTSSGSVIVASGPHASVVESFDSGASWLAEGRPLSPLDLTGVWVTPTDGSIFFTTPTGLITTLEFHCAGPLGVVSENLPQGSNGETGAAALWGSATNDLWAVGPGGIIRNRR
jgi:photosystem II stability/assembly factor-like uncharacterized protein